MKKIIIIQLTLIALSFLNASVMTGDELQENLERSFDLERTIWDGMVKTKIDYSQKNVSVGDTLIVTIYFEIDTEKNQNNIKLAIADLAKKFLYTTKQGELKTTTKEDVIMEKEYLAWEKHGVSILETDPDLVLSNEKPFGSYNFKIRLNRKKKETPYFGTRSNFSYVSLPLFFFYKSTEFENITDYDNQYRNFRVYFEVNPDSMFPENSTEKIRYYERSDFQREKKKQEELINKEKIKEENLPKLKFNKKNSKGDFDSRFNDAYILVDGITGL